MEESRIRQIFDARIKKVFHEKDGVRNYLINHERKPLVIQGLQIQLRIAQLGRKHKLSVRDMTIMIESMADFFSRTAIQYKEQLIMSEVQKAMKKAEASQLENAKGLASEVMEDMNPDEDEAI